MVCLFSFTRHRQYQTLPGKLRRKQPRVLQPQIAGLTISHTVQKARRDLFPSAWMEYFTMVQTVTVPNLLRLSTRGYICIRSFTWSTCKKGRTTSAVLFAIISVSTDQVPPMTSWMWPCASPRRADEKDILSIGTRRPVDQKVGTTCNSGQKVYPLLEAQDIPGIDLSPQWQTVSCGCTRSQSLSLSRAKQNAFQPSGMPPTPSTLNFRKLSFDSSVAKLRTLSLNLSLSPPARPLLPQVRPAPIHSVSHQSSL